MKRIITAETTRPQSTRREKLKSGHYFAFKQLPPGFKSCQDIHLAQQAEPGFY
jgi:hypothetical protein